MAADEAKTAALLRTKIGKKGEIRIEAGLYKGQYPTVVEETDGLLLGLAHPLRKSALLPIYRDLSVAVYVEDEKGPVMVRGTVVRTDLSGAVPLLWVRSPLEVENVQRRRFLRVDCFLKTQFWVLEEDVRDPLKGRWRSGIVLDVSLGGFKIQYPGRGEIIRDDSCLVFLPIGGEVFPLVGKIVWTPKPKEGLDVSELGVEFTGLPRLAEKALTTYIRLQETGVKSS